jgi:hypothetical protein
VKWTLRSLRSSLSVLQPIAFLPSKLIYYSYDSNDARSYVSLREKILRSVVQEGLDLAIFNKYRMQLSSLPRYQTVLGVKVDTRNGIQRFPKKCSPA